MPQFIPSLVIIVLLVVEHQNHSPAEDRSR